MQLFIAMCGLAGSEVRKERNPVFSQKIYGYSHLKHLFGSLGWSSIAPLNVLSLRQNIALVNVLSIGENGHSTKTQKG